MDHGGRRVLAATRPRSGCWSIRGTCHANPPPHAPDLPRRLRRYGGARLRPSRRGRQPRVPLREAARGRPHPFLRGRRHHPHVQLRRATGGRRPRTLSPGLLLPSRPRPGRHGPDGRLPQGPLPSPRHLLVVAQDAGPRQGGPDVAPGGHPSAPPEVAEAAGRIELRSPRRRQRVAPGRRHVRGPGNHPHDPAPGRRRRPGHRLRPGVRGRRRARRTPRRRGQGLRRALLPLRPARGHRHHRR